MQNQKRLFCWGDSPVCHTGYGVVVRQVLTKLHQAGYEIEQLGINYHANFLDKKQVPWQIIPAKYHNPQDPYGNQMFIDILKDREYDYVWILNDYFVVNDVGRKISEIKAYKLKTKQKIPKFIYYYPVDYKVLSGFTSMIEAVDYPVVYNQYGEDQTVITLPHLKDKLHRVPHGVDVNVYKPLGKEAQDYIKTKFFGINPKTYMVLTVSRNSVRKQLGYALWAFKKFKEQVKDSVFYLHTSVMDQGGDLSVAAKDVGLDLNKDVIFPHGYSPQKGIPDEVLNQIYNASDMFFMTHCGEGHCIPIGESMAAGTPVVAPNNSNMPDFFGKNSERGYMYECKDKIFIDNVGLRPKGNIQDIVGKMIKCYKAGSKWNNPKVRACRTWAEANTWDKATDMWVDLFKKIEEDSNKENDSSDIVLEELD